MHNGARFPFYSRRGHGRGFSHVLCDIGDVDRLWERSTRKGTVAPHPRGSRVVPRLRLDGGRSISLIHLFDWLMGVIVQQERFRLVEGSATGVVRAAVLPFSPSWTDSGRTSFGTTSFPFQDRPKSLTTARIEEGGSDAPPGLVPRSPQPILSSRDPRGGGGLGPTLVRIHLHSPQRIVLVLSFHPLRIGTMEVRKLGRTGHTPRRGPLTLSVPSSAGPAPWKGTGARSGWCWIAPRSWDRTKHVTSTWARV